MSKSKFRELFVYFLKLGAEHVYVSAHKVATECDVEPVSLFSLDDELARGQILGAWLVFSGLRDYIDQQVPNRRSSVPVLLSINCH
jgi:hypothetical protein